MTIVFCPGKLIGCPGYFFHDLGRIHASLIRLPYCSTLMSLGLVVLLLSLTSAPIAWLSPQVWLARSTCVFGLRQSNWQFQMGQSLIIACVLYCPLLFHWYNVILRLPSLGLGTVLLSVGLGTYAALCLLTPSGPCLPHGTPIHKF